MAPRRMRLRSGRLSAVAEVLQLADRVGGRGVPHEDAAARLPEVGVLRAVVDEDVAGCGVLALVARHARGHDHVRAEVFRPPTPRGRPVRMRYVEEPSAVTAANCAD